MPSATRRGPRTTLTIVKGLITQFRALITLLITRGPLLVEMREIFGVFRIVLMGVHPACPEHPLTTANLKPPKKHIIVAMILTLVQHPGSFEDCSLLPRPYLAAVLPRPNH